jgi:mannose-1-phosphate guanylyltransferase
MQAMLLAAGLGTRLGGLSDERPKPLLPVCDRPLVRWAAALCVHHGLRDLTVNLHHLGEKIRAELGDGSSLGEGVTVDYSVEQPQILGTGGGVKAMAALRAPRTVLVMNAKIVTDLDLHAVIAAHRESGALATMVLAPDPQAERWGAIGVDGEGNLVRLLDERRPGAGGCTDGEDFMFTGVHLLEPELIAAIPAPPYDGPCCIIRTAYRELFRRGAPLRGFVHRGYFAEHSTPARYLRGNFNLLEGKVELPARPGPLRGVDTRAEVQGARLHEPVLVGAGARVEAGAELGPRVVVGAGARVAAGVALRDAVIWPGVEARESATGAVVTARGVLRVPPEELARA